MSDHETGATPKPKRRPGAPRGNLNVLKHGFYSRLFRQIEHDDLEATLADGLESEVNMMRVIARRVMELVDGEADLDTEIRLLNVLGVAATRLAKLMRTQVLLGGGISEGVFDTISHELDKVNKELCKP